MESIFKLVVIEDDPGDQKLIKLACNKAHSKMTIEQFFDAEEADSYLNSINSEDDLPELIILDLNLPKISGLDYLKKIKTDEKLKVIPVVVLTTSDAPHDIETAYKNGANSYFRKPLDVDELISKIKLIINYWTNSENKKKLHII